MPELRMFISPRMVIVPRSWLASVGGKSTGQAYLVAVARKKADAGQMLQDAGAHPRTVDNLRLAAVPHGRALRSLVMARIVTFDQPGLWAYERFQQGGVTVKADGRQVTAVARWVQGAGTDLIAEPLSATTVRGGE